MKLITFRNLTKDEAEVHFEKTLPRTVHRCCGDEHDGFHCTLFEGHDEDHEAWGIGRVKLEATWPNINNVRRH